jgi:hypothetical protein
LDIPPVQTVGFVNGKSVVIYNITSSDTLGHERYKLTVTQAGTAGMDIIAPGQENIIITAVPADRIIHKFASPGTLTLTGPTGYDSYAWFIDGARKGSGRTLTPGVSAGNYSLGTHTVNLEVSRNGYYQSVTTTFTVQN